MRIFLTLAIFFHCSCGINNDSAGGSGRETISADAGGNVTLHCPVIGGKSVNWIVVPRRGLNRPPPKDNNESGSILADGSKVLFDLDEDDANEYICQDADSNESIHTVFLQIRTVPPQVTNLTVHPHTVFALVTWMPPPMSNTSAVTIPPVAHYLLRYRRDRNEFGDDEKWIEMRLNSSSTTCTVYGLTPASTYYFSVIAVNSVGEGKNVTHLPVKTGSDPDEIQAAHDNDDDGYNHEDDEATLWKLWIVGIAVMIVTFSVIGFGISLLLIRNCDHHRRRLNASSCETTEEEAMELVPHITLNPSFNIDMLEYLDNDQQQQQQQQQQQPIVKNGGIGKRKALKSPNRRILSNEDDDDEEEDDDEINLVNSPAKAKHANNEVKA